MEINRRFFFKAIGATAAAIAVGQETSASEPDLKKDNKKEELHGMLYDMVLCKGCHGCEYDCAEAHQLAEPVDTTKSEHRLTDETRCTVVNKHETSKGEVAVKTQCMHCSDPACGAACLTQAMYKTEHGAVIWREDKCMGCRYCMISCPFDVPKFEYQSTNPRIIKCDMCYNLIQEGEIPACSYYCPSKALTYGKRSDLIRIARKRIHDSPEKYEDYIYGENEAGGTSWMYISPVPFNELGMNTTILTSSYPALTKGFISSIAPVDILLPAVLLGIYEATKSKNKPLDEEL